MQSHFILIEDEDERAEEQAEEETCSRIGGADR